MRSIIDYGAPDKVNLLHKGSLAQAAGWGNIAARHGVRYGFHIINSRNIENRR